MLPHMDLPRPNPMQCPYPVNVVCDPKGKYRTYDARCNNLRNPLWGAAHQPLSRFIPPHYADGERLQQINVLLTKTSIQIVRNTSPK